MHATRREGLILLSEDRGAGVRWRRRSWAVSSRRLLGRIVLVVVLLLLALPAGALADTIHLEVSALSTPGLPRESHMTITASGLASSASDEIHVASPSSDDTCPSSYPGIEEERIKHWTTPIPSWELATSPDYSANFYFPNGASPLICGYLTDLKETIEYSYMYETVTLASAELRVTYGSSEREIEEAKQHQEEAAHRQGEELEEAKKHQEETTRKYEEEAPARQAAKETAEVQAKKAAEEKAIALAHNTPVNILSVTPRSHPQHSHGYPGHTVLEVTTDPYAYVTLKLTRFGHLTERYEWGQNERRSLPVQWTCDLPGGTYRYTVTSHSNVGPTLTRHGTFSPVSSSRCRALRREEAEAREHGEREYAEEQRRIERVEHELLHQYEANCRAAGGIPITLHTIEGSERACRAQGGGLIPVPI
jgi:hypothetical protein